jgi:copper(I)-binding protein
MRRGTDGAADGDRPRRRPRGLQCAAVPECRSPRAAAPGDAIRPTSAVLLQIPAPVPKLSRKLRNLAATVSLAAVGLVPAAPVSAQVAVTGAWVRGTVAGQMATGAFMRLESPIDAALVAAASPVAKIVEIHQMRMDGGMMRMSAVDRVALPAGKAVDFAPGGYHVMLMDLAKPLHEGDTVPLRLTFEDKTGRKSTLEVRAQVRALTAGSAPPHK